MDERVEGDKPVAKAQRPIYPKVDLMSRYAEVGYVAECWLSKVVNKAR